MTYKYNFFNYFEEFDRRYIYDVYYIYYYFYNLTLGDAAMSIQESIDENLIKNFIEPSLNTILSLCNLNLVDTLNVFRYGSIVYGTDTEKSDFDYIVINNGLINKEINIHNINIRVISCDVFKEAINNCEVWALECLNLKDEHILHNAISYEYYIDKSKLRRYVSEKSSHSFVKAKKKFIVEKDKDIYVGKKSLFHSLRVINFGIQLASTGKINKYDDLNDIFVEIMENTSESWEYYNEKYKPIYNHMMSNFRLLAPKE